MQDWKQNAYLHNLLTGSWTGTETGTGTGTGSGSGSSRTLRRRRQSQEIEADSSEDDLEESTPRQTKKKKGDSEQGTCYYFWPSHLEGKSSNFI